MYAAALSATKLGSVVSEDAVLQCGFADMLSCMHLKISILTGPTCPSLGAAELIVLFVGH